MYIRLVESDCFPLHVWSLLTCVRQTIFTLRNSVLLILAQGTGLEDHSGFCVFHLAKTSLIHFISTFDLPSDTSSAFSMSYGQMMDVAALQSQSVQGAMFGAGNSSKY